VYAVEATDMAKMAKQLVDHNGLGDTIEVIQGTIETVSLPEKVDIIISEWMGYFLLRESMLDSVLVARDKFLKPEGALYPSHCTMYMAPIWTHNGQNHKLRDYQNSVHGWDSFVSDMHDQYDVDMRVLTSAFRKEQEDYFLQTSQWTDVHPEQLMGPPVPFKKYDLKTLTLEELKAPLKTKLSMTFDMAGRVEAFCGWFDVSFEGSPEQPAYQKVILDTAPDATGATHWGQQSFYVGETVLNVEPGHKVEGEIVVARRTDNQRLLAVEYEGKTNQEQIVSWRWNIE
jgi:type I protein arginine methyltransferase